MNEIKNKKVFDGVKTFLTRTRVLDSIGYRNILLYPLATESIVCFDYLTLDEALESGVIEVTEKPGGSVPELEVENKSTKAILLLNGEELKGGRQNRTLNTDILVKPKTKIIIPVSCTERGRWGYAQEAPSGKEAEPVMRSAEYISPHSMRKDISKTVGQSLGMGMGFQASQSRVWQASSDYHASYNVPTRTGAIDDVFSAKESDIQKYLDALRPDKDTWNGMAIVIDNKFVGLDIFDSTVIMAQLWDKLVRSYALDALRGGKSCKFDKKAIQETISAAISANMKAYKSVSLGYDVRIEAQYLLGSALAFRKVNIYGVAHLSLFSREVRQKSKSKMSSATERMTKFT